MGYSPTLGRFISRDPLGYEDGMNTYQAVRSNPINLVDPFGLKPPVFKGFEDDRFQKHDDLIEELVRDFNANKEKYCGCTANQEDRIGDLSEALVKAWLIQESGGSPEAWDVDPAQVNVPGDWNEWKEDLGLKKPTQRNEGTIRQNLEAAIKYLCRKGFGKSGQPPRNRPEGFFDGWPKAIERYNGRTDMRENGKTYSENYRDRIIDRANNPDVYTPIPLPGPKPPEPPPSNQ